MKLQLSDYDKIIFDLDGVITSERVYWQTAALTAYDLLINYEHYGHCGIDREWCRKQYSEIYNSMFSGGRLVQAVKRLGVNSNWDLAYIVFCVSKYLNPELDTLDTSHFQSVCMFIENIDMKAPEVYSALEEIALPSLPEKADGFYRRGGDGLWAEILDTFQSYFHGTDEFEGMKTDDRIIFEKPDINRVLQKLRDTGARLGVGTGRPKIEAEFALKNAGIDKYFDNNIYTTYDEVVEAEKELKPKLPLSKPDPFVFLKAALGENHTNKELIDGDYTYGELERVLVVGDAPCDLIAAKKAGFSFLGVLTGIDRNGAKKYFEENNADYILDSVLDMEQYC